MHKVRTVTVACLAGVAIATALWTVHIVYQRHLDSKLILAIERNQPDAVTAHASRGRSEPGTQL